MARSMEIRETPNVGMAVVPGVVCVGGFAHMYGYIAGNDDLPKKIRNTKKSKKAQPNKQTSSVVVLGHFEPGQLSIVRQSCKGRFREMSEKNPDDKYGSCFAGYRNKGRKPRYKDHTESVGKTGKMRQHLTA